MAGSGSGGAAEQAFGAEVFVDVGPVDAVAAARDLPVAPLVGGSVWVPIEHYDRVAKDFARTAKDKYLKKILLQRLAPIGVIPACVGNCSDGAGCGWILIEDGGDSKVYVCDCVYTS